MKNIKQWILRFVDKTRFMNAFLRHEKSTNRDVEDLRKGNAKFIYNEDWFLCLTHKKRKFDAPETEFRFGIFLFSSLFWTFKSVFFAVILWIKNFNWKLTFVFKYLNLY